MPPGESLVETLYSHPNVKIVSFTASLSQNQQSPGRSSSSSGPTVDEPGTLPWTSPLERSIAIGPLSIYRAPGSVAFLNCGSALQPILPKSQCWAMDEESTIFVLQIRRPHYWRIELPTATDADDELAQLLPDVFDKVLQFEKTVCPFRRGFTVEVPEAVPVIWRRWMPRPKPEEPAPEKREYRKWPTSPASAKTTKTVRRRDSDISTATVDQEPSPDTPVHLQHRQRRASAIHGESGDGADAVRPLSKAAFAPFRLGENNLAADKSINVPRLSTGISDTAPQQYVLATPPPPSQSIRTPWSASSGTPPATPPSRSPNDNYDYPPTFSASHDSINLLSGVPRRRRLPSDMTVTPESRRPWDVISTGSSQESQESNLTVPDLEMETSLHKLDEASSTAIQRRPSYIRHRSTLSGVGPRPLASLPSAATLFSSTSQSQQEIVRRTSEDTKIRGVPMQIISKAAHVFLGPPVFLAVLMLKVAAKILAGEWRGLVFGVGEHGEEIPVRWDYSDEEPADWNERDGPVTRGAGPGPKASRHLELD